MRKGLAIITASLKVKVMSLLGMKAVHRTTYSGDTRDFDNSRVSLSTGNLLPIACSFSYCASTLMTLLIALYYNARSVAYKDFQILWRQNPFLFSNTHSINDMGSSQKRRARRAEKRDEQQVTIPVQQAAATSMRGKSALTPAIHLV